jgi:biopolymer transport protein ExbB
MENNPYGLLALWSQGGGVIKGVALVLLLMSISSWYIILTRSIRLYNLRQNISSVETFWRTHSFDEGLQVLGKKMENPFYHLAIAGQTAVIHHTNNKEDLHGQINLADWLSEALRANMDEVAEKLQSGLSVLASVGSTAPFVGLFGTVWGIYHALVGIGISGQASIDKVAGPVGEALIMTAFGLAVAIPAVLAYNALNRSNKSLLNKLNRYARQLHAYFLTGSPLQKEYAIRTTPLRKEA